MINTGVGDILHLHIAFLSWTGILDPQTVNDMKQIGLQRVLLYNELGIMMMRIGRLYPGVRWSTNSDGNTKSEVFYHWFSESPVYI